ncbi:hypothetical protein KM043_018794, partial [Ampulex compressa]
MAAEENAHDGAIRHGRLIARKIRGRPRHGTELGSRTPDPGARPRPFTSPRP